MRRSALLLATTCLAAALGCATDVDLPWGGSGSGGPTPISTTYAGDDFAVNECFRVVLGSGFLLQAEVGTVPESVEEFTRLLVVQVQDAPVEATTSVDPSIAIPLETIDVGHFDYVPVHGTMDGNTLTTIGLGGTGLTHRYVSEASGNGSRRAQACTVPRFHDLHVEEDASLVPPAPWDADEGWGGILAFEITPSGTATIDGELFASDAGFEGGQSQGVLSATTGNSENVTCSDGGEKGEGVFGRYGGSLSCGRAAFGSGGGGGNGQRAGGGGGSNGGPGGAGGGTRIDNFAGKGVGGARVAQDPEDPIERRLVMGGGGGGAHAEACGGDGGNGGGIIAILGDGGSLLGDGDVEADGAFGEDPDSSGGCAPQDGAGAGGAGGSVLIQANASGFTGTVSVEGGGGGVVEETTATEDPYGCGGGGSGGRVYTNAPLEELGGGPAGAYVFGPTAQSCGAEDGAEGANLQ